ncbi:hypothetical protein F0562_034733 [Nyssa sinensis]|uniref:VTT domain-containing protein n=1 Tax=Nyssa sinensis TaxID=561372 RepID=A0A5J5ACF9_9ASTE|nr:hypothetical protein F0562_034733 [Nyssa sinensis]
MSFNWVSVLRIALLLLLLAAITTAFFTLPIEKILKDFLQWIEQDLGPWGPLVLAVAYIPLTVLCSSSFHTYCAVAAFLLGRTIGRSFVISKLKDYPQFRAVAIAIQRSGFKIVLLLRLVPLLPFNMLNYLLSVTPVPIGHYMLASWLGMMPITLALVYVGTTLKDLSDVTHGWNEFSKTRWAFLLAGPCGVCDSNVYNGRTGIRPPPVLVPTRLPPPQAMKTKFFDPPRASPHLQITQAVIEKNYDDPFQVRVIMLIVEAV